MLMTSAPASTATATTSARYPMSVRVASMGENSTSPHRLLARRTASSARTSISSRVERIWCSMCRSLVPTNVWMRGLPDHFTASHARSMSALSMRARPATVGPATSEAMRDTDSKSPSEVIGNPASMTSTLRRASWWATSTFSSTESEMPGDCSPSLRVVSKICTRRMILSPSYDGELRKPQLLVFGGRGQRPALSAGTGNSPGGHPG
jgi:hypothetical protein